ncbi:MAG: 1-deoxy-D-xylulose-5-phosphate reductoisomerase [Acidobacteria bacterium]|nr:MAG: 1-deoxy-D-xylulose-5-phosphate reductoisomerase [Acidobacteriota bacterium]
MKSLSVLGSTGSIGISTLSVVESFPDRYCIEALAAGLNLEALRPQIRKHQPSVVAVRRHEDAATLAGEFPGTRFTYGPEGLEEVACAEAADTIVAALVGSVGLAPTLAAIRAGKSIALANKETLVVAGDVVMAAARDAGIDILPVDSEHNAIHQALRVGPSDRVKRLILTASGGPFRTWSAEKIAHATLEETLNHPTWKMGPKITVDSATMMNKGLEIIEAHHLFGMPSEAIDVVVHPQSLVHSLVEYVDGTLIAQLSVNDMRFPIMYALAWPDRLDSPLPALDLAQVAQLTFEAPDPTRFPALRLARQALKAGGEMPAVMNAANEVAVAAFLEGACAFTDITVTVEAVMDQWAPQNRPLIDLEQALAADDEARHFAAEILN